MIKYSELNLGQIEAIVNKLGGMEGVKKLLAGQLGVKETDLLRQITRVSVPGTEKFVAKEHLKAANIGYTGGNFDNLFLKKVEENVEGVTMAIHRLEKGFLDAPILAELGNRAEISLAHLFQLIEKQSNGEDGPLLTNGYANIAYIRGTDGNLWAVYASWHSSNGYWDVVATSVENPGRWNAGHQVLSRDS